MDFDEAVTLTASGSTQAAHLSGQTRRQPARPAEVIVDHKCVLGKWIYSEGASHFCSPRVHQAEVRTLPFSSGGAELVRRANSGESVDQRSQPVLEQRILKIVGGRNHSNHGHEGKIVELTAVGLTCRVNGSRSKEGYGRGHPNITRSLLRRAWPRAAKAESRLSPAAPARSGLRICAAAYLQRKTTAALPRSRSVPAQCRSPRCKCFPKLADATANTPCGTPLVNTVAM
jgi:hypothetical protein